MSETFDDLIRRELAERASSHLLRLCRVMEPIDATHVRIDGRVFVNFCSNNYLALAQHPRVIAAMQLEASRSGAGAGASPLICGYHPAHAAAEIALASWKKTEAAVLLPSGYQANHAAVQTLAAISRTSSSGARFLLDKLAHASLIDAVRGCDLPLRVFRHNDIAKLRRLLKTAPLGQLQIVVTESIFSMDGDEADFAALAKLKSEYPFFLLLDEAHSTGVYGPAGSGLAAERGFSEIVDATVVTLSKGLGVAGGAICASKNFCDAVRNFGRAYIYSTSISGPLAAAATESLAILRDEPHRQTRLCELSRRLRARLGENGWRLPPGDSPILPIIVGSESAALALAEKLADAGLLAQAVRPPTVPRGFSRLRVTLCSEHQDEEIDRLVTSLATQFRSASVVDAAPPEVSHESGDSPKSPPQHSSPRKSSTVEFATEAEEDD